jgi:hypothetical protein
MEWTGSTFVCIIKWEFLLVFIEKYWFLLHSAVVYENAPAFNCLGIPYVSGSGPEDKILTLVSNPCDREIVFASEE